MSTTTNDRTLPISNVAKVTALPEGCSVAIIDKSGVVLESIEAGKFFQAVRDSIQIGGRNYVRNSQTVTNALHETNNYNFASIKTTLDGLKKGDCFTISCDEFETSGTDFDVFQVSLATPSPNIQSLIAARLSHESKSQTIKIQEDYTGEVIVLVYPGFPGDTANKGITVSHLKVERGNIATDWTPAPEDIIGGGNSLVCRLLQSVVEAVSPQQSQKEHNKEINNCLN